MSKKDNGGLEAHQEFLLASLADENRELREKIQELQNQLSEAMRTYKVSFTVWHSIIVDAIDEDSAYDKAAEKINELWPDADDICLEEVREC